MQKKKVESECQLKQSYEVLEVWKLGGRLQVRLNGEPLKEVDCFKYLRSQVATDGGSESHVVHRMSDEYIAWGALKSLLNNRELGIHARSQYEGVIVPTALYGTKARGMRSSERRKVNVLEMKLLRSLVRMFG